MTAAGRESTGASMKRRAYLFAAVRLTVSLIVIVAIVATFFDTASRARINPFNFFGFFTMQSNIIAAVTFIVASIATFRNRWDSPWLMLARACATTYIVIVGVVYNTLLAGLEGGVSLDWANFVLHVFFPVYAALDWLLFGDRRALPWSRIWVVAIYPLLWLVVVITRGATDGWVPYPFLNPAHGYGSVFAYCIGIFALTAVVASIVFALSRVHIGYRFAESR